MEGKTILAFVSRGNKFADCSSYTEVTSQVDCKAVANLDSVTLPASCGGSTEGKTRDGGVLKTGCYSNRENALIMKESHNPYLQLYDLFCNNYDNYTFVDVTHHL